MSKYHPLDVRHPANRDRERNNYLLAPPDASSYELRTVARATQAPSRRSADYRTGQRAETDAPAPPPAAIADPWGGSGTTTGSTGSPPVSKQRRGFGLGRLIVFGIIAYFILRNTAAWDEIRFFVTRTLYDLGLL